MEKILICRRMRCGSIPEGNVTGNLIHEWRPLEEGGAAGRNRTGDPRIFSPLLYQLSYRGAKHGADDGI